jgi:hypothetical protein
MQALVAFHVTHQELKVVHLFERVGRETIAVEPVDENFFSCPVLPYVQRNRFVLICPSQLVHNSVASRGALSEVPVRDPHGFHPGTVHNL